MNIRNLKIEGGANYFMLRLNLKYSLLTALFIAVCTAAFIFYPTDNFSNEALFSSYYEDFSLTTRAGDTETGAMCKAITLIKDEHYSDAIEKFNEILKQKNFYTESAQWYLTLCLLKTNADEEKITERLCKIITDKGKYSAPALEILTKRYQHKQEKQPK
jgi:hypothetical protein